jgi:hypothetical protein
MSCIGVNVPIEGWIWLSAQQPVVITRAKGPDRSDAALSQPGKIAVFNRDALEIVFGRHS